MEYIETYRPSLWKGEFPWKAHLKLSVYWSEDSEIWNSVEDKEFIEYIDGVLNFYAKDQWVRQGAVYYCKTVEAIFQVRMRCDERIIKIEKAIANECKKTS